VSLGRSIPRPSPLAGIAAAVSMAALAAAIVLLKRRDKR
jgi:hypothetical protein